MIILGKSVNFKFQVKNGNYSIYQCGEKYEINNKSNLGNQYKFKYKRYGKSQL